MAIIYKFSDFDLRKTCSYADYLLWQFQERVELIKGKIFEMSRSYITQTSGCF
jgi:hypothetical protein